MVVGCGGAATMVEAAGVAGSGTDGVTRSQSAAERSNRI